MTPAPAPARSDADAGVAAVPLRLLRRSAVPAPRHAPLMRPDWSCDNCETANAGRRRRCADCGTSRV